MNNSLNRLRRTNFTKGLVIFLATFSSLLATAQSETSKTDVALNGKAGALLASPWIWVAGIVVFVLLLVALLRGNERTPGA